MTKIPEPNIIEELGACMVVNKPGGLLTQGPPGIDSLEFRIKRYLKIRDEKPGKVYLGVPHRLDRPASGIMLFAKNVRAAKRLSLQFQERTVGKKYWAVVEGNVSKESGVWQDYMMKLPDEARSVITTRETSGSQDARLRYKVLARERGATWLEIQLETGRTHQIRLQACHRGHPIIGDQMYGATVTFGPKTNDARKRWIALHAREIVFEHPMTRETFRLEANLWDHWRQLKFELPDTYVPC